MEAIGRYRLCEEIASGGMATVHLGRLLGAGGFARTVAIKRLHAPLARDPEFVAMFMDEARLAARISHPNVVPVLDVVTGEGELFLVMEYVRGAPLSRLRTRGRKDKEATPVPPAIAVSIVCGALAGLHAAHEATDERGASLHIVHRDVSPQNILVGIDGIPRVLDFGIAKATGRLQTTRRGQLKGKLSYMAPEQIEEETASRATDVYAASVVLWEALTGKRLFLGNDEHATIGNVLAGNVPPPSEFAPAISPELDQIVLRGLARDPAKRYSAALEMVHALSMACPIASPLEVGAWVASLAEDEIARSAQILSAIEQSTWNQDTTPHAMRELVESLASAARDCGTKGRTYDRATCTGASSRPFLMPSEPTGSPTRREEPAGAPSQPSLDWNVTLTHPLAHVGGESAGTSRRTLALAVALFVGIAPATLGRWLVSADAPRAHVAVAQAAPAAHAAPAIIAQAPIAQTPLAQAPIAQATPAVSPASAGETPSLEESTRTASSPNNPSPSPRPPRPPHR